MPHGKNNDFASHPLLSLRTEAKRASRIRSEGIVSALSSLAMERFIKEAEEACGDFLQLLVREISNYLLSKERHDAKLSTVQKEPGSRLDFLRMVLSKFEKLLAPESVQEIARAIKGASGISSDLRSQLLDDFFEW